MCCRRLEALGTTTESSLSWCLQLSLAKSQILSGGQARSTKHDGWQRHCTVYAVKVVLLKSQFQLSQSQEKGLQELVLFVCTLRQIKVRVILR